MKPNNAAYIAHIRDAIEQILLYAAHHTHDQYLQNSWDQAAVARNLEIIGEAATQLTAEYKNAHPAIPWRKLSDFRNVLTHEYFAVDSDLVWEILQKDIPILQEEVKQLLEEFR
ncbi:MAG: DUF86 domain-containing protein [Candidatus Gottesmanbacteria bacterium]|nr:DUF86 domain-containing protein [Candidatus Gottesmanbacteria bacterium]